MKIKDCQGLFDIHKHLFQDIYHWAGKPRMVEISKDGKQFFPTAQFGTGMSYIDNLILDYRKIHKNKTQKLAEKLGEILDYINYFHPFREGNGRAQREFIRTLALEKGLNLNLNSADNVDVYERYMQGTINSDQKILSDLIFDLVR